MAGNGAKDIKLRMKSVESTMQTTKAMQLVATSKLRRARERMQNSKPYAEISEKAISAMAANCKDDSSVFISPKGSEKRLYVVIAGDRGLAGGYNNNIFKLLKSHSEGSEYAVVPVGKKALEHASHYKQEILTDKFIRTESMKVGACFDLASTIVQAYKAGAFNEVWVLYTDFKSMMTQNVAARQILPLKPAEKEKAANVETIYEPDAEETLDRVVPDYLAGVIYSCCCSSFVSEVAARRSAMDSATKNATSMISSLTLKYNRARQGAITQEITEIVAGSER